MNVQTIVNDGKPVYAVIPWDEYQALRAAAEDALDAAEIAAFRQRLEAGEETAFPAEVAHRILDGQNPVKVWREYRKMTQDMLAAQAGISKAYLCQIETGKRAGAIKTLRAIAAALGLKLDDLQL